MPTFVMHIESGGGGKGGKHKQGKGLVEILEFILRSDSDSPFGLSLEIVTLEKSVRLNRNRMSRTALPVPTKKQDNI